MDAIRDVAVRLLGDASDVNKAFGDAEGGATTMGSSFKSAAAKATVVFGALTAGVAIAKNFADAAGDLDEATNKAGVTFGDAAGDIVSFAESASSALGLSERAALDFASSFGTLLKPTGVGEDAVADMSTALTQLTADLGSFHNLASEDVAAKLFSGLSGEAEPMRALGVDISAAAVAAKALELGLGDASGELTNAEKVQARYALILEQTADAQGDFERTSDGLANSQKILGAEWENMKATLGEQLAPAFAAVFGYAAEVLPQIVDWLGPKLTGASEALGAWWDENGESIATLMGGIGAALDAMWVVAEPILENLIGAIDGILTAFSGTVEAIQGLIDGDWGAVWEGLKGTVEGVFEAIDSLLGGLPGKMLQAGKDIMSGLWDGIEEVFWGGYNWLVARINDITGLLEWIPGVNVPDIPAGGGGTGWSGASTTKRSDRRPSNHYGSEFSEEFRGPTTINNYITVSSLDAGETTRELLNYGAATGSTAAQGDPPPP